MEAIEEGAADFAVLPIENSTAGSVDEMYDLLVEFENYIRRDDHSDRQYACRTTGNRTGGYPAGILKRRGSDAGIPFLDEHGDWQQISVANTAIAAKKVLDEQDKTQAAVCSAYAPRCMAWRCWRIISMMIMGIPPDSSWSPTRRSS